MSNNENYGESFEGLVIVLMSLVIVGFFVLAFYLNSSDKTCHDYDDTYCESVSHSDHH